MSEIRVGGIDPAKLYFGEQQVQALYRGSDLLWPAGARVSVPANLASWSDFAPGVFSGKNIAVPLDAIVWEDFVPEITIVDEGAIPLDELVWEDFAPVIAAGAHVEAPADAAVWADFAPSISISVVVAAPADALDWTDYAPVVVSGASLEVPSDETVWNDYAPGVSAGVNIAVPVDLLAWRDFGVVAGYGFSTGFSSGFNALPSAAGASVPADALAWTDYAPTIEATVSPAAATYAGAADSGSTNSASHSLLIPTGAAPGVGEINRLVAVAVYMLSASLTEVTAATIGGITAQRGNVYTINDSTGRYSVQWIWAFVPTGTSATVAITLSTSALVRLRSFRAVNILSGTPVHQAGNSAGSVRSISAFLNTVVDGIALSMGSGYETSVTWVMTGVNQDFSLNVWNPGGRIVGGSLDTSANETGREIKVSYSGGDPNAMVINAISFR